jgi:hypothetical protein
MISPITPLGSSVSPFLPLRSGRPTAFQKLPHQLDPEGRKADAL